MRCASAMMLLLFITDSSLAAETVQPLGSASRLSWLGTRRLYRPDFLLSPTIGQAFIRCVGKRAKFADRKLVLASELRGGQLSRLSTHLPTNIGPLFW